MREPEWKIVLSISNVTCNRPGNGLGNECRWLHPLFMQYELMTMTCIEVEPFAHQNSCERWCCLAACGSQRPG